jgi:hypothetical protein
VLQSNIAACHLKLQAWKEAVKTATEALDRLDKLQDNGVDEKKDKDGEEEADEEIVSAGAQKAEDTSKQGTTEADIERIRTKALLRRARARSEQGGWSGLQGAEDGMCCLVRAYGRLTCLKITRRSHRKRISLGPIGGLCRYN